MPPMTGSNSSLPPIRSGIENIDSIMRRPSLPTILNPPALGDRRASLNYQRTSDYHDREEQRSIVSSAAHHTSGFPSAHERAEFTPRGVLPCSYSTSSSRSSPASHNGSPAGDHQPLHRSQDDVAGANSPYTYSSHTGTPPYSIHGTSQISLPPAAQLFRPEPPGQLIEVTMPSQEVSKGTGCRLDLAPLDYSARHHPYRRRDPVDDKTLMRLPGPRSR